MDRFMGLVVHVVNHTAQARSVRLTGEDRDDLCAEFFLTLIKDDFAVLKIDRVPEGLKPLPLDLELDARQIPKLSRVASLGFPLGSRTHGSSINVSVSSGHVRRSFENLVQVDASFYGGNSGGPIIDLHGNVIGIASGVAMDLTPGLLPMVTPLWNMAMIQPILVPGNKILEKVWRENA